MCVWGEYVYVYLCQPVSSMRGGYCLGPTDVVLSKNFALESSAQVKRYIGPQHSLRMCFLSPLLLPPSPFSLQILRFIWQLEGLEVPSYRVDFLQSDRFLLHCAKRDPVKFIHLPKVTLSSDFTKVCSWSQELAIKQILFLFLGIRLPDTQASILIIPGGHSYTQEFLKQKHGSSF